VALAPDGDAYFPEITAWDWEDAGGVDVAPNPRDNAAFRIRVYHRRYKG
jgi:hypothetical protein